MVLALEIDQPVWIVRPVLARRKMILRPVEFVVGRRSGVAASNSYQGENNQD